MNDWFDSPLGRALLLQERRRCDALLPSGYYPSSLQVTRPSVNFLRDAATDRRFFVDQSAALVHTAARDQTETPMHCARAAPQALPFAHGAHNLIILPHTLDFCADAHAVLREVHQVLAPHGCLVITGFNPLSFWGAAHLLLRASHRRPWNGRYRRVGQVQDWLALLGFELAGAAMLFYQPPLQNEKLRARLAFLDDLGARWWPGMGAVYVLVGRKKVVNANDGRGRAQNWRRALLPGIAQPAAQNAARSIVKKIQ